MSQKQLESSLNEGSIQVHGISLHHDLLEESGESKVNLVSERHSYVKLAQITQPDVDSFAQRLGAVIPREIKQVKSRQRYLNNLVSSSLNSRAEFHQRYRSSVVSPHLLNFIKHTLHEHHQQNDSPQSAVQPPFGIATSLLNRDKHRSALAQSFNPSYSQIRRSDPASTRNKSGVVLISVGNQQSLQNQERKHMDGGALMEVFNQFSPTGITNSQSNSKFESTSHNRGVNLARQPAEIATLQLNMQTRQSRQVSMDRLPPPASLGSDTDRFLNEQTNIEIQASLLKQQRRARFSQNKFSPLKSTAKSIGIADYQAYQEHAQIVPYNDKLSKLDTTNKATKLSFLINEKSGALHEESTTFNYQISGLQKHQGTQLDPSESLMRSVNASNLGTNHSSSNNDFRLSSERQSWIFMRESLKTGPFDKQKIRRQQKADIEKQIQDAEKLIKQKRRINNQIKKQLHVDLNDLKEQLKANLMVNQLGETQFSKCESEIKQLEHGNKFKLTPHQEIAAVGSFYKKVIHSDSESQAWRMVTQANYQRETRQILQNQIEFMAQQNLNLRLKIKHFAEAIEAEERRQQQRGLTNYDAEVDPKKLSNKISLFLQSSFMATRSNSDFGRVEKISRYVKQVINAKRPSDCILAILMACKEAFKDLARATLFIVDPQLINLTNQLKQPNQTRHFKSISCEGVRSGFILAVTDQDTELCSASFTSLTQASQVIISQSTICLPYFGATGQLQSLLQLETKPEMRGGKNQKHASQNNVNKSQTDDLSRINPSENVSHASRKITPSSKNGWTRADIGISKIISSFGGSGLEIFLNKHVLISNEDLRQKVTTFVNTFGKCRSFKEVIKGVSDDIPKLLGYQRASLFLADETNQNLLAMFVDKEKERILDESYTSGFEKEYVIDRTQIVQFSTKIGLQGLSFQHNAIAYCNNCQDIVKSQTKPLYASLFSLEGDRVEFLKQTKLGEQIGQNEQMFFNSKTDNFLEIEKLFNFAIAPIQDEEYIGNPQIVGTLQLYNKLNGETTQNDLARLYYIRKLVGSTIKRCEHIAITLQTLVGINQGYEHLKATGDHVDRVMKAIHENSVKPLSISINAIKRQSDFQSQTTSGFQFSLENKYRHKVISRKLLDLKFEAEIDSKRSQ